LDPDNFVIRRKDVFAPEAGLNMGMRVSGGVGHRVCGGAHDQINSVGLIPTGHILASFGQFGIGELRFA
jgi:hypothetical protein